MSLKIVTYHYVRPIKNSDYPNIKGLELDNFCNQLDYFKKKYNILKFQDIFEFITEGIKIPKNSLWLTFDDGYNDHYKYVLPELLKRKIQGTFFPPAKPIINKKLLDVNAIHFILEKINNSSELINSLKEDCKRESINSLEFNNFWNNTDKNSRYDDENTIFFKRMLQRLLPEETRSIIITRLLEKYLKVDETTFCNDLYMSENDVKSLLSEDMFLGSHTYNHFWLNSLTY